MGRPIHKLTDREAQKFAGGRSRKLHGDGGGLYLGVAPPNGASWVFRYTDRRGTARTMGLGAYAGARDDGRGLSLERARERALELRKLIRDGGDPMEKRAQDKLEKRQKRERMETFKDCAAACIKIRAQNLKNKKHIAQWSSTLETFAFPIMGELAVADVTRDHVEQVLKPIWATKHETATRVRQRIEAVLDYAAAKRLREGENPARWDGALKNLLGGRPRSAKVQHQPALPYVQIGAFMADLRQREGNGALALQFAILTAARPGEVTGATWGEINLETKTWSIPEGRMKKERAHRVPLSDAAVAVLETVRKLAPVVDGKPDPLAIVFPGMDGKSAMSDATMNTVCKKMGYREDLSGTPGKVVVPHGFRASFRSWGEATTDTPFEVLEAALSHAKKGKEVTAYARDDLLDRRRPVMDLWGKACTAGLEEAA